MAQPIQGLNRFSYRLPRLLEEAVNAVVEDWRKSEKLSREWNKDPSVWTRTGEEAWLGWLDSPARGIESSEGLEEFGREIRKSGFRHVVLLGMGGSSLCAEVIEKIFGQEGVRKGFPTFRILDSTDPAQIRELEENLSIEDTLFVVSSKSGSTLEPNVLFDYFFLRVSECVGKSDAGSHFLAITDPGSSLELLAKEHKFKKVFLGDPGIGGRYSVLSSFGMVPAALMGVDTRALLKRTLLMAHACGPDTLPSANPAVLLGAILGTLGKNGRDKVTIACSRDIEGFGAWLEQLLAESTGKEGRGLIPIVREQVLSAESYGSDRVFVHLQFESSADPELDSKMSALEAAGQPVIRISIADRYGLGQEFFRWEAATAVAGSILRVNPFNQPDVEASKVATRQLTDQYEKTGELPEEVPAFEDDDFQVFDHSPARAAHGLTVSEILRAHLEQIKPGDYFALLAYVPMNRRDDEVLQLIRTDVLRAKRVATCAEFGPRFLHSTGQVYKGGPNSGVFLQITSYDVADMPVPGHKYSFGMVKAAEAQGDLAVLTERGRRVLRIHLRRGPEPGLDSLRREIEKAVA